MPCTILEAMRVVPVSPQRCANSLESMVKSAVARQTNALVRIPGGAAPQIALHANGRAQPRGKQHAQKNIVKGKHRQTALSVST